MEKIKTISNDSEAEIIEKKSKFIANLYYVNSIEEVEEKLKNLKKKYYDARHNCYAYRIIKDNAIIERASDDGEPSGTAGAPMLNIIKKMELANILIVVTRYFGGILLGTGGLVRAYSDATIKAINSADKVKKVMGIEFQISMEYSQLENFKYYCQKNKFNILNTQYSEDIVCNLTMEEDLKDKFIEDFETKKINLKEIKILDKKIIDKSI